MSDFYTKDEALALGWELIQKNPGQQSAIQSRLEDEFGITADEFSAYDSTVVSNREVKIAEDRLLERADLFKDIRGFSQSAEMSDAEILRTFNSLYELEERQKNAERVPTEAEWYIAGVEAANRIKELEPLYKVQKAEEWDLLTQPSRELDPTERDVPPFISKAIGGTLLGATGLAHEILFGWIDFFGDYPEGDFVAHERGFGTSWNPLTGFGAWDLAESRFNPETGGWGFSEDVLANEKELNDLYSIQTFYNEQMTQGGYDDKRKIDKQIKELMATIPEGVVDPRRTGEIQ
jgi:hypothetical protein